MSDVFARGQRPRALTETGLSVARMADLVCEATRRAALDGVTSALAVASGRALGLPDVARDIAEPILSRASIMQIEIDRFMAVARSRQCAEVSLPGGGSDAGRGTAMTPSSRRSKGAFHLATPFIASEKEQTMCRVSHRKAIFT